MKLLKEFGKWTLTSSRCREIHAQVPGDISHDLYCARVIPDPYWGMNHLENNWIIDTDFIYETRFLVDERMLAEDETILEFEGIDTFSEIYLNGTLLGKTENMFLAYSYSVRELLVLGENVLRVKMISTLGEMKRVSREGYFGTFNTERLFIRKAQCHFGWDWAPDMPGYGIYKPVRLYGASKRRFSDVSYKAYNDGAVTILAELNYNIRSKLDYRGDVIEEADEEAKRDVIRYTLATLPDRPLDEAEPVIVEKGVIGSKNFVNFKLENPELWWPRGYGEHPLYAWRAELINGGRVLDKREGRLAFREISLSQRPMDRDTLEYRLSMNGTSVFVRGSNWVPAECFTGIIKDEKYERLISLAAEGNLNMLRVWGGGIYENDIFYDICDESGMMVWQDMMFACSDIPEDDEAFVENCKREINYQIRRLRNHPSIVYWCGGNEKTGSYGLQISKGDYFIDVILRGLITNLDDTRPFARQSPCSFTEIGNDMSSGESHSSAYESALVAGVHKYRELVAGKSVPFISECAVMGPDSLEAMRRIFPEEKLWPMNGYWDDRLMDNPYAAVLMPFSKRQKYYADELYGETRGVSDFIAKGMTAHAELMRAEAEYARFDRERCSGFMSWMFSDIWPSGTWSAVDYYCEPKQVYYQMKRSFAPVLAGFSQSADGKTYLGVINDTREDVRGALEYGFADTMSGVIRSERIEVRVGALGDFKIPIELDADSPNIFLFVRGELGGEKISAVYSPAMWSGAKFESNYAYSAAPCDGGLCVRVKANKFAKGIILRLPENYKYDYSDNYFDLLPGEEREIYVRGACAADAERLVVTDFAKETSL